MTSPNQTNVLLPFAEQTKKWDANEASVRVMQVIDRALSECRDCMEQALNGLEQIPPTELDLTVMQKGGEKLKAFAKQLNIPDALLFDELNILNDAYVGAKVEARTAHTDTGKNGTNITRAISNAYAAAHARAILIKEALAPHLRKKAPKPLPKDDETAGEIDLAPKKEFAEGDTGIGTEPGTGEDKVDFTVGDAEDPLAGTDIASWLQSSLDDEVIPMTTKPAVKPAAHLPIAKPITLSAATSAPAKQVPKK